MTAPRSAPPASRRPRIPAPSDVVAFRAHLVALAILLIETIYWLSQPCVEDVLCAPILGFYTIAVLIPLALALAVWRLSGRGSGVLCIDAVVAGFLIPLSLGGLGSADPMIVALLLVLP